MRMDGHAQAICIFAEVCISIESTASTSASMKTDPRAATVVTAVEMSARQREISVSESFTKNRHLLGFDNPAKPCWSASRKR